MTTPVAASPVVTSARPQLVEDHDIVIVGGGLVGCALAIALGRAGLPVTVLERTSETPELLRGELVLPAGVAVLRGLGLLERLAPLTVETLGVELRHPAFPAPLALDYPAAPAPPGLCGWRRPLYEALRAAARATPGVELRDGVEVVAVERAVVSDSRRLVLSTRGGVRRLRARLVVAADGQASRLRHLLGFAPVEDRSTTLVQGLVVRAPRYARRRVTVGANPLGAAFVFPFPDGLARVTFEHRAGRRAEVAARDHLALLREALPDVWEELGGDALEAVTELQVQPGRSVTLAGIVEDGVALAGDAAGCLDPFTGHGMALGLLDAATLAATLAASHGDASAPALRGYEAARTARLAARREATEALCHAFLHGVDGADPLAQALAARLGARWRDPRVAPALCAQAAGFDLPVTPSFGERLFALGVL